MKELGQFNTLFGVYDFNTFARVDFLGEKRCDYKYIQLHEIVHMLLASNTLYGTANYVIDQLSWKTSEKNINLKEISNELLKASVYTHEAIATFSQYSLIRIEQGSEAFEKAIDTLRKENQQYYEYIEDLVDLLRTENFEHNIENILQIGVIALNIDLTTIPLGRIKEVNNLGKFLNDSQNKVIYNPDYRFRILKSTFHNLRKTETNENITAQKIADVANILYLEFNEASQFKIIQWLLEELDTLKTHETLQLFYNEAKESYTNFNKNETINHGEILKRYWYSVHPSILNSRYKKEVCKFNDIKDNLDAIGAIFITCKGELTLVLSDIYHSVNYTCKINDSELIYLIKEINTPFIIMQDEMEIPMMKSILELFPQNNKRYFLYIDIAYVYSKEIIEENISITREVTLFQVTEDLGCIFYKGKNNNDIIQLIAINVIELFIDDINNGIYKYINLDIEDCKNSFCPNGEFWFEHENIIYAITQINAMDFSYSRPIPVKN